MDDFRIKIGYVDHPKTIKLIRLCGELAFRCHERLIDFCARTAGRKTGDLVGMDVDDLEIAASWLGDRGLFAASLQEVGYIDGVEGSWKMHDWADHQPWVAGFDGRSNAAKRANAIRWHKKGAHNTPNPTCPLCSSDSDKSGLRGGEKRTPGRREADSPTPHPFPHPFPSPLPHPAGVVSFDRLPDEYEMSGAEVDQAGTEKYGQLGGPNAAKLARLCPVKAWEMKAALNGWPEKWGGFADCIIKIREESSKPKPPKAGSKAKTKTFLDASIETMEARSHEGNGKRNNRVVDAIDPAVPSAPEYRPRPVDGDGG